MNGFPQPIQDPEKALAASVIFQALTDLFPSHGNGPASQAAAQAFLTDTSGRWARARADWCDQADVDADAVRRHALSIIARRDAQAVRRTAYPLPRVETA